MANPGLEHYGADIATVRRAARHSAHIQRIQVMLAAAGLSALGIVMVAGALLTNLF